MIYIHCNAGKGHRATYHDILNGYNCWCGRPFLATEDQKEAFLKQERALRDPTPEDPNLEAERQQQLAQEEYEACMAWKQKRQKTNDEYYAKQKLKREQEEALKKQQHEARLKDAEDLGFKIVPVDTE
jgi:hypothetical protein